MTELETIRGQPARPTRAAALTLFLVVVAAVVPFMHPRGEQQMSRYVATAAIWDRGTFEVTAYAELLGRDGSVVEGTVYSDKAPGQPVLGVPFYGIFRLLGGEPLSIETQEPDFGLWWLTVWTAGIPLGILAVLMYRWSLEIEPDLAMRATLTMVFGSLLVVYGTLLFAHVVTALFVFSMFLLVRSSESTTLGLFVAGLLGGSAVVTEFPAALVVAALAVLAVVVHHSRAWLVVAGGVPMALLLGLYNMQLFGSPFIVSYQWNSFSGIRDEAAGTFDMFAGPSLDRFVHVLFSERGLLIATPVIVMAAIGLVLMWREGRRRDASIAAVAFLSMLAIQFSWGNSYAGGAGPRYVTPGLPFLVAGLAVAWRRWKLITAGLAALSILTMVLATVTDPQLSSQFYAGLGFWVSELMAGEVAPTIYTVLIGPWGWLLHIGSVVFLLVMTIRADKISRAGGSGDGKPISEPALAE